MQEETKKQLACKHSKKDLMKIDQTKTKVMKVNTESREPVTIGVTNIEEVTAFVNLGSKITTDGK